MLVSSHYKRGDKPVMAPPVVILLAGPTASGKTDLAISLAKDFPLGLISVDAAQVYRGMDIGTAKPSSSVLKRYPHALIDICEPAETFSAGKFSGAASREIKRILSEGRMPMLVGGSMFYIAAVTGALGHLPPANRELRKSIEAEARRYGWETMHTRLKGLDPESAHRIDCSDGQRIQRALEIIQLTGKPIGASGAGEASFPDGADIVRLAVTLSDRGLLHNRIEHRVDRMLHSGLVGEVKQLMRNGLDPHSTALRTIGYRQAYQYLEGALDYEEMRSRVVSATRQLAKRQLTWLRNTPGYVWFDTSDRNVQLTVRNYLRYRLAQPAGAVCRK